MIHFGSDRESVILAVDSDVFSRVRGDSSILTRAARDRTSRCRYAISVSTVFVLVVILFLCQYLRRRKEAVHMATDTFVLALEECIDGTLGLYKHSTSSRAHCEQISSPLHFIFLLLHSVLSTSLNNTSR